MTKEQSLRSQIKPRFVDFLKAAELMYVHPELTSCPHCNRHASVIQNFMWSCPECHKHGDVVDYVMDHAVPGDLILTLGCGDIYKEAKLMCDRYREKKEGDAS